MKREIELINENGLHARASALFVRTANKYKSKITIEAHGEKANGKSIIGIMALGAFKGENITLDVKGIDEKEAMDDLINLIENKFSIKR